MRSESELFLERIVDVSPELVFKAWTSAEHVKTWFAPTIFTIPEARVEMRPGGAFEVCMRAPDGTEHWTRGVFAEVINDDGELRCVGRQLRPGWHRRCVRFNDSNRVGLLRFPK